MKNLLLSVKNQLARDFNAVVAELSLENRRGEFIRCRLWHPLGLDYSEHKRWRLFVDDHWQEDFQVSQTSELLSYLRQHYEVQFTHEAPVDVDLIPIGVWDKSYSSPAR